MATMKVIRVIEVDAPGLGQMIRRAREKDPRNMTQIAAAAGMSTQNWYRIEDERQSLPEETLRAIEQALGVDFGIRFDPEGSS